MDLQKAEMASEKVGEIDRIKSAQKVFMPMVCDNLADMHLIPEQVDNIKDMAEAYIKVNLYEIEQEIKEM